jgi:hypothetical protein
MSKQQFLRYRPLRALAFVAVVRLGFRCASPQGAGSGRASRVLEFMLAPATAGFEEVSALTDRSFLSLPDIRSD